MDLLEMKDPMWNGGIDFLSVWMYMSVKSFHGDGKFRVRMCYLIWYEMKEGKRKKNSGLNIVRLN